MLQWRFVVAESGAIVRKMDKKKQGKQRRKLRKLYQKEAQGEYARGTTLESCISWCANAARGDTYHERKKMVSYYRELEETYGSQRI